MAEDGIFDVQVYERDFSNFLTIGSLRYTPERLIWQAIGGAAEATVAVNGPKAELWKLVERLRCPVEILAEGTVIWNGYIESVTIQAGKVKTSISIEGMYNRICVTYAEVNTAGTTGERKTTTWYQDDESVAAYAVKEKQISLSQGTAEEAENRAKTRLESLKYPIGAHEFGQITMDDEEASGSITCRGWWHTLDWKYYENSSGKESYEEIGNGLTSIGNVSNSLKTGQSFQISTSESWLAAFAKVRVKKEGNPTDNLLISLCADSSGAPGSVLASGSLSGTEVSENLNWVETALSSRVTLQPATTYWITVGRSGGVDAANYYKVDANEELGYTSGVMRVYNGSAWAARSPDADMLFQVGGVAETSTQLANIINTSGQFFSGLDVDDNSGIYSSPYRDGDESALACVEELLESGTTALRRLMASVDAQRRVIISVEPAAGDNDYRLYEDNELHDPYDRKLQKWQYPVGVWARLMDLIPGDVDTSRIADPSLAFVEEVTYDATSDDVSIRERDFSRLLEVE